MINEKLKTLFACIWGSLKSQLVTRSKLVRSKENPTTKPTTLNKEEPDTAANDREIILSNGWKQGAAISSDNEHFRVLGLPEGNHDIYLLASHSCDIASYRYTTEPSVEFIGAYYKSKEDKSLAHRRNPRKLQIPLCNGASSFITLDINSRYFVDRRLLVTVCADESTITEEALNELQMWLASRYRRSAFPDAFNSRVFEAKKIIEEDVKKNGDRNIYGLYLHINTLDELEDANYEISILGIVKEELGEAGDAKWREAEDYLEFVAKQFRNCEGIAVNHHEVVANSVITLKDVSELKLLDFDYLSHKNEADVPEPIS